MSNDVAEPSPSDAAITPAAQRREKQTRGRAEARRRYRDHLSRAFAERGVTAAVAAELAEVAMAALFDGGSTTGGDDQPCRCSCHPRLPDSDQHDYGFNCPCTHTPEQRRRAVDKWRADLDEFRNSPDGQRIQQRKDAEEAELQAWLATQPDVTLSSLDDYPLDSAYPEQWKGTVAGHSFYFRERWGDWHIELDLRPTGHMGQVLTGFDSGGTPITREQPHTAGDVIAEGTTGTEGYGATPLQRAQFILGTIRTHLARQTCSHHRAERDAIAAALGAELQWCPSCGTRL